MNNLGPLTGGVQPVAPAKATVATGADSGAALLTRTNSRVVTPPVTAAKQTTSRLGQLLDANGIRDPRKIPAGTVIKPVTR
jgi:hypothetical protein